MPGPADDVIAVVPAAGESRRYGGDSNKLFEVVNSKTVIEHTLDRLCLSGIRSIILACHPGWMDEFRKLTERIDSVMLVEGGATRRASVGRALEALERFFPGDEERLILVHDGARCCVSPGLVRRAVEAARKHGAVSVGVPLTDTIKHVGSDGIVVSTAVREGIWTVQTPQVFRFSLLRRAHGSVLAEATDDAGLVESIAPVYMVEGEAENIKITRPADLKLAGIILKEGPGNG